MQVVEPFLLDSGAQPVPEGALPAYLCAWQAALLCNQRGLAKRIRQSKGACDISTLFHALLLPRCSALCAPHFSSAMSGNRDMPAAGAALISAAHIPAVPWPDSLVHTSEAQFSACRRCCCSTCRHTQAMTRASTNAAEPLILMLRPHAVQAASHHRLPLKLPVRRLKLLRHPLPRLGRWQQVQVRVGALAREYPDDLKILIPSACQAAFCAEASCIWLGGGEYK